jgi:hypothetical protein
VADETARHRRHDLELVAAHAAGETAGAEIVRAEELVESCDRCLELARDLREITLQIQSLPDAARAAATQPPELDFRLTPEQASRLRPGAPVVRLSHGLAAAFASFGRPLGASMATLGVVGLLVGAATLPPGGAANLSFEAATTSGASGGAADVVRQAPIPAATRALVRTAIGPAATDPPKDASETVTHGAGLERDSSGATVWLLGASTLLLLLGVGLIVVATRGRSRHPHARDETSQGP